MTYNTIQICKIYIENIILLGMHLHLVNMVNNIAKGHISLASRIYLSKVVIL